MTRAELHSRIADAMAEMFDLDRSAIIEGARFVDDLDLDSIDAIDMAVRLQELTGKRVPEDDLRSIRTVGDIVDLAERLIREA